MKNNWIRISLILVISIFLQSCLSVKEYQRPQEIEQEALFRTDNLPQDSISLADFSYTEIFQDPFLQSYIERGLQNNLDIRIALQNIAISEAYFKQSKAAYFPTLSAGPNVTYGTPSMNSQQGVMLDERTWATQYGMNLNSSWEADIWGKLKSAEKAQYASYLQTVAGHQAVKSQIVRGIASLYFQILALDEQHRTTSESIALQESSVETTEALKEAGQVTEVAVQQTSALLLNYKSRLIEIENAIKIAENQLSYLMGESPQEIERGRIEDQLIPEEVKTGFPVDLLRNRPDVIAAEQALVAAFQQTQVARTNLYPSLTLSAQAGIQSLEIEDFFNASSLFANIVGGITQPIFQQRRLKTQKEVSEYAQEMALLNFKESLLNASLEVSNAIEIYESQDEIIELKTQEHENYNLATEYSQELLNYGLANYLEVLTAQQNSLNAKLAEINAKYTKLNALVDLYSALGGGWK